MLLDVARRALARLLMPSQRVWGKGFEFEQVLFSSHASLEQGAYTLTWIKTTITVEL